MRLTTHSNIMIGYEHGRDSCGHADFTQCDTRVVYEYHTPEHDVKEFVKSVLFDDIYRNGIRPKVTTIGNGSEANASDTSGHQCFAQSATHELTHELGAPASSQPTSAPTASPVYTFGECTMTCEEFVDRVYTGLSDQIPHDGRPVCGAPRLSTPAGRGPHYRLFPLRIRLAQH